MRKVPKVKRVGKAKRKPRGNPIVPCMNPIPHVCCEFGDCNEIKRLTEERDGLKVDLNYVESAYKTLEQKHLNRLEELQGVMTSAASWEATARSAQEELSKSMGLYSKSVSDLVDMTHEAESLGRGQIELAHELCESQMLAKSREAELISMRGRIEEADKGRDAAYRILASVCPGTYFYGQGEMYVNAQWETKFAKRCDELESRLNKNREAACAVWIEDVFLKDKKPWYSRLWHWWTDPPSAKDS